METKFTSAVFNIAFEADAVIRAKCFVAMFPVGSLDTAPPINPTDHIFWESRRRGVALEEGFQRTLRIQRRGRACA